MADLFALLLVLLCTLSTFSLQASSLGVSFAEASSAEQGQRYAEGQDNAPHKVSEGDRKRSCHYRISCYQQMGFLHLMNKQQQLKHGGLLSSKLSPPKEEKKRTMKQIAHMAVREVEKMESERKKKISERDGKTVLANRWNELKRKISCKYRKSCYGSGEVPKIEGSFLLHWFGGLTKEDKEDEEDRRQSKKEMLDGMYEQLKHFCRYRKSCYKTGIRPKQREMEAWSWDDVDLGISHVYEYWSNLKKMMRRKKSAKTQVEEKEEEEDEWEDPQRKLECKYRRSCYETGELPEVLRPIKKEKVIREGSLMGVKVPTSIKELKLFCKYRKSCYVTRATAAQEAAAAVEDAKRLKKNETERIVEKVQQQQPHQTTQMMNNPDLDQNVEKVVKENVSKNDEVQKKRAERRRKPKANCAPERAIKERKEKIEGCTGKKEVKTEEMVKEEPEELKKPKKPSKEEKITKQAKKDAKEEEIVKEEPEELKTPKEANEEKTAKQAKKERTAKKKYQVEAPIKIEKAKVWSRKWEGLSKEARLKCRYRKSCYSSGVIPELMKKEDSWDWGLGMMWTVETEQESKSKDEEKTDGEEKEQKWKHIEGWDELNNKEKMQKCRYRKSCYEWMEKRVMDSKETQKEPKKKEAKMKKVADLTPKTIAREVDKKKREDILRREALFKSVDLKTKLYCKYRKSCYEESGGKIPQSTSTEAKMPITVVANKNETEKTFGAGQKCNQWRISCREAMGLPIREKAPIGPNGKKLCRKRKVDEEKTDE